MTWHFIADFLLYVDYTLCIGSIKIEEDWIFLRSLLFEHYIFKISQISTQYGQEIVSQ